MSDPCDLLQLFQLCRRRYAAALHPVERTWGLTRNEIDVILFLSNHPGLDTARDIVALRSRSKSHVCKSVDRLTRRGFLAGAQDAQLSLIHLYARMMHPNGRRAEGSSSQAAPPDSLSQARSDRML